MCRKGFRFFHSFSLSVRMLSVGTEQATGATFGKTVECQDKECRRPAWEGWMTMDKQERGRKSGRREDVRKQVRVAEEAASEQAKRGKEDFMKQMMDYQYHED